jgi:nicotinate-nucleotide pyrophosphorylase (carboxylating)
MVEPLPPSVLREAAARALGEDRGPADVTSLAVVSASVRARARIFAKEPCRLAGVVVAERVFMEVDPALRLRQVVSDGRDVVAGETVLEMEGLARSILTGERAALNFVQQLSGVATMTARFVAAAEGRATILDTRKTVPGLRALQKYAVRCGGGQNHRFGLYDAFMIKDNHIALMGEPGGLASAVRKARAFDPKIVLVVEADTIAQVEELAGLGVDRILLDNMSCDEMKEAVAVVAGRCQLEASGNMSLERISSVAATGVDFISVGALTHSVPAIDFSLELYPE